MLNFDLSYLAQSASPLARLSDDDTDASSVGADDSPNTSGGSAGLQSGGEEAQSPPLPQARTHPARLREETPRPIRIHTSTPEVSKKKSL